MAMPSQWVEGWGRARHLPLVTTSTSRSPVGCAYSLGVSAPWRVVGMPTFGDQRHQGRLQGRLGTGSVGQWGDCLPAWVQLSSRASPEGAH